MVLNHPGTSLKYLALGLGWVKVWASWGYLLESPSVTSAWDRLLTSLEPASQGTQTEAISFTLTQSQESYGRTSVAWYSVAASHEGSPIFNGGRGMHLHLPPEGRVGKVTLQKSTCHTRFCCNHIWKVKLTKYHDFNCYNWMKRVTEQRTWGLPALLLSFQSHVTWLY